MIIFIRTPIGKTLTVSTGPDHSVANIKSLIHDQEGIPPSFQRLVFNGKELQAGTRIQDLSIQHESTLTLVLHLRGGMEVIIVTDSGTTYTIPAKRTDVLSDIRKRLVQFHEFNSAGWTFVHDGRLLVEEMSMTLGDYNFGEVTLLTLQQKSAFPIEVKMITGRCEQLMLTGKESVLELIALIRELLDAPLDSIRAISRGVILRETDMLSQYNIHEGMFIVAMIMRRRVS
jgi:hypothetical protein